MNNKEKKYTKYVLTKEMLETVDIVKNFEQSKTKNIAVQINSVGKLLLTGEGSSRIFPAKNAIRKALISGLDINIITEGSHQAGQYDLSDYAVFFASNSGRTKEVLMLAKKLCDLNNPNRYAITANINTILEEICNCTFILNCGWEQAVAATKSVIEQALFYESIITNIMGRESSIPYLDLANKIENALGLVINYEIIKLASEAEVIYFAGYNDGVAEELALKTNEITRKKSDYLEGTYAVHGIEEVLNKDDIIFLIDPIEEEIEKFNDVLKKGVGINVVAIATHETKFPTILVPDAGEMNPYVFLTAGWNLLVEIGLVLNINLEKPERARKVGNEYLQKINLR